MKTLIVKIERPAYGGYSIARHERKIVMVKGPVLPEETAEVVLESEKKDYLRAAVTRILEPSPDRTEPVCSLFNVCGGCQLQHATYDRQVSLKEEILKDCLHRLAKTDIPLSAPVISTGRWHYRKRGQFKASRGELGFYRTQSREVISLETCNLMSHGINNCLTAARSILQKIDFRELHIHEGNSLTVLIKVPAHSCACREPDTAASMFLDAGFKGICIETPEKRTFRYGLSYTTLDLNGLEYTVSPGSFFQANWDINRTVVGMIKSRLMPLENKRILDLYAGAGNFTLPLSAHAETVAVEGNPSAIKDGRRNAKLNNIITCSFIRSGAEHFHTEEHFNILVLDPPRAGLTKKVMKNVLAMMPDKIVYISCNPATFARDLEQLSSRYDIESIRLADFFPQTFHIESLAFLSLR